MWCQQHGTHTRLAACSTDVHGAGAQRSWALLAASPCPVAVSDLSQRPATAVGPCRLVRRVCQLRACTHVYMRAHGTCGHHHVQAAGGMASQMHTLPSASRLEQWGLVGGWGIASVVGLPRAPRRHPWLCHQPPRHAGLQDMPDSLAPSDHLLPTARGTIHADDGLAGIYIWDMHTAAPEHDGPGERGSQLRPNAVWNLSLLEPAPGRQTVRAACPAVNAASCGR